MSSESTDDEIKLPKRQISCGVSAPDLLEEILSSHKLGDGNVTEINESRKIMNENLPKIVKTYLWTPTSGKGLRTKRNRFIDLSTIIRRAYLKDLFTHEIREISSAYHKVLKSDVKVSKNKEEINCSVKER